MGRPGGKQFDDVDRPDIAAVNDLLDIQAFEQSDRFAGVAPMSMRVAHHTNSHNFLPAMISAKAASPHMERL